MYTYFTVAVLLVIGFICFAVNTFEMSGPGGFDWTVASRYIALVKKKQRFVLLIYKWLRERTSTNRISTGFMFGNIITEPMTILRSNFVSWVIGEICWEFYYKNPKSHCNRIKISFYILISAPLVILHFDLAI